MLIYKGITHKFAMKEDAIKWLATQGKIFAIDGNYITMNDGSMALWRV
jgi:hypothetical protein